VSTDSDEQFTSYEAQIDYYTKFIKARDDWEFVTVYTDEGISATNTKYRDGFNQMVQDALDGKIDLIVTKSVSRFARNTVDSLTTVRKLKEHGTEVYFEKENIFTFDSKGELLITIMSSLAQEESRSISENVTWGQRKRFADGKVSMPYKRFLGYDKGEDGTPVINEEEAGIVKLIYQLFLEGKTPAGICRYLDKQGILTPSGKNKWSQTTVNSILSNEKYKGDALLQKWFTVDFLMKTMKANGGEVPQYYVENSHEAIINPTDWDIVQAEIARRKTLGRSYSGNSVFSSRLVCSDCGSFFGQKVWHYAKTALHCDGFDFKSKNPIS
jgi:DNA invertase Pin-like site-specific DNA recombinase